MADVTHDELTTIRHMIQVVTTALRGSVRAHLHIHVMPRALNDRASFPSDPRSVLYRPDSRAESLGEKLADVARALPKATKL